MRIEGGNRMMRAIRPRAGASVPTGPRSSASVRKTGAMTSGLRRTSETIEEIATPSSRTAYQKTGRGERPILRPADERSDRDARHECREDGRGSVDGRTQHAREHAGPDDLVDQARCS